MNFAHLWKPNMKQKIKKFHWEKSWNISGALRDLVPFVQFKKREKHPWRSVNFSKVAGWKPATLLRLTLLHGCFLRFLNCANGSKSINATHKGLLQRARGPMDSWNILWHLGHSYIGSVESSPQTFWWPAKSSCQDFKQTYKRSIEIVNPFWLAARLSGT